MVAGIRLRLSNIWRNRMFEVSFVGDGEVQLSGTLDASQVERAREMLGKIAGSCTVNFKDLHYISSAGLGILLTTQKRLGEHGHKLKLVNLNKHISDVFRYAGFDKIFTIE